jgi:hypothetical protein
VLTLQNGSYKVGYIYGDILFDGKWKWPTFEGATFGWATRDFPGLHSPVSDINTLGQVVGTSLLGNVTTDTFAAFSAPGLQNHGGDAALVDNLNNYIKSIPGVSLTSAVLIDDQGRILAKGSDSHEYLLSPTALGPAATVPEPPAWMMLILASGLFGVRSVRRGWRPGAPRHHG